MPLCGFLSDTNSHCPGRTNRQNQGHYCCPCNTCSTTRHLAEQNKSTRRSRNKNNHSDSMPRFKKKIPIYPTNLLPYPSRIPLLQLPKSFKQHRIHHWANRENPDLISCWWLQGRPTGTVHLCCSASSRLNLLKWVSHPSGCQRFVVWKYILINSI